MVHDKQKKENLMNVDILHLVLKDKNLIREDYEENHLPIE
jgi:hypothetical protein